MSAKRRDKQGRVLRTGESQRKDGLYEYRYTDANKKRRSIYSADLMELRKKEDEIQVMRYEGIDYAGGEITVLQLVERYTSIKRGVRYNTQTGYRFVLGVLKKQVFGQQKIRDIKMSDAKLWVISLFDQGYSYSTIASIRGIVKPAFQMAYILKISSAEIPSSSDWISFQTILRKGWHCQRNSKGIILTLSLRMSITANILTR